MPNELASAAMPANIGAIKMIDQPRYAKYMSPSRATAIQKASINLKSLLSTIKHDKTRNFVFSIPQKKERRFSSSGCPL